jgi:hypothetical protein
VRVEEFSAEASADMDALNWTLTASYSRYPDESTGILAEYEVQTNEDAQTGQVSLSLSGRIVAPDAATAHSIYATLKGA